MEREKHGLRAILEGDAAGSVATSSLTKRLLSESELDWVSGGETHSMCGTGSYDMGAGNGAYSQTGGSFTQSGDDQGYIQASGTVTWITARNVDGG